MVAGWRDVCQHVGVGLNPGDLAKFPAVVSVCVSVSWLVVTEVIGFVWGGGWLQSVKCQVCFQWDCASGPLCWSLTRFVFLRENGRVNDGRLYQISLSRLSFDGFACILLSCVVYEVICKTLHVRNTWLEDASCVVVVFQFAIFVLLLPIMWSRWIVICVMDPCLHIEGQWMWLYNFMIPLNSITRLCRQPSASILVSIWHV